MQRRSKENPKLRFPAKMTVFVCTFADSDKTERWGRFKEEVSQAFPCCVELAVRQWWTVKNAVAKVSLKN